MFIQELAKIKDPHSPAIIQNGRIYSYKNFLSQIIAAYHFISKFRIQKNDNLCVIIIKDLHLSWIAIAALHAHGFKTITINSFEQIDKLKLKSISYIILAEAERIDISKSVECLFEIIYLPDNLLINEENVEIAIGISSDLSLHAGHILYTSGTTGIIKGILLENKSIQYYSLKRSEFFHLNNNTVFHNLYFPPNTGSGYKSPLATWLNGGCVVFNQEKNALFDIFKHNTTLATLTPLMFKKLVSRIDVQSLYYNPNLTLSVVGGFLSEELAKNIINKISPNLIISYSSTEVVALMKSSYTNADDLMWLTPQSESEYVILRDDKTECGIGEEGDLAVKINPHDPSCYLDDPEASEKVFRDGYFFPGDLAVKRGDGKIRILGRISDVLNINGQKVSVAPIENQIQSFLKVSNVCIFSTFTDFGANLAIVAVETDIMPTNYQMGFLKKILRSFDDVIIKVLSEFPRTETVMEKIDRRALREQILKD